MNMKYADEILIEYLEGTLDRKDAGDVEKWLNGSAEGRDRLAQLGTLLQSMKDSFEYAPPEQVDWEFKSGLEAEIKNQQNANSQSWLRIAAAVALLIAGFALGKLLPAGNEGAAQLATLQGQIDQLQQLVMMGTLQDHSASERLQVVSLIEDSDFSPSDELISTLVNTMNGDDSPNVRYAAVQALGKFLNLENVRMEMVRALEYQKDPLIQIAMINLLVQAEEKSAIAPIKKIIEEENTSEEVKKQAKIAMDILI